MVYKAAMALISCVFAVGCSSNQQIINKIQLVQTAGYDKVGDRSLCSVILTSYIEKGKASSQLLLTESDSSFDMIPRLNTKTSKTIQYGQMGMVLFSKTYAEMGIGPVISGFCRDPKIASKVQMGVTDKEASKMMEVANKAQESLYLMRMVEQNVQTGNLPKMNFKYLLFNYYGEGRDIFLPYFNVERGSVKIDGLALFKQDKFVTKVSIREAFLLKLLTESSRNGNLLMPMKADNDNSTIHDYVLMKSIASKANYHYNTSASEPIVEIGLRVRVLIKDTPSWLHLNTKEQRDTFERQLGSYLEKEAQDFIALCQSKQVDPIGLGDFVRSRTRTWNEKDFYATYPKLRTQVTVHLSIEQSGVGEL
ncbi:Ger(x)C family spore germination protein [Paenibacillus sp. CGMCC 1.16610]|uniref:Ger(X)C family spore germination protein n=1 Tax=Paenibacillus anseongense TaxID=2682845 RepID=A0ABW9U4E9_9BACL|nr:MULTISPECIES: Ger(x)C family spore germination protein [Paenibacillus]MBA2940932.1 Ger(x)C family spore germination protein [Paenibacillus sp. CGMCC 1.16610]MVQ34115.1 Ger(x)C family spore germination protein [Paenibacillus anseongense]